jgi:hypothetical protein
LRLHSSLYFVWGAIIVLLIAAHFIRRGVYQMKEKAQAAGSEPAE